MVIGKLYRSIDRIAELSEEIKEELSVEGEVYNCAAADDYSWLIAKVEDISCGDYAYGMALLCNNQYVIRKIIYSDQSDYLVDGCIRMLVNEIFDCNHQSVIAEVGTSTKELEQVYRLIGFIVLERAENHLRMKIDKNKFKSHKC